MNVNQSYESVAAERSRRKTTHVSFPQMKYPSLRDGGLKDSVQWLEGRKLDDGAEGLWRVHDGLYDVTNFMKNHPGGAEWLRISQGMDITEAFETHHVNPSVQELLKKFYVREAVTPRNSPFTFAEDGFYRSLKRKVWEELPKLPKNASKRSDFIIDSLLALLLVSSAVTCWASDWRVWVPSFCAAFLSLTWMGIAAHNYLHQRDNWRMYLMNMTFTSFREWRVSHVLSHHSYPNTLYDMEVTQWEPVFPWMPRPGKSSLARLAVLLQPPLFASYFLLAFAKYLFKVLLRTDYEKEKLKADELLGLTLPIWMWLASGCQLWLAIQIWLGIMVASSFWFCSIGFNAAHHHPDIFHDGDEIPETMDWGLFQLRAVMDRVEINATHFNSLTHFGDHGLHHLFPTADAAILRLIHPLFVEHCRQFQTELKMSNIISLMIGQVQQLGKTTPTINKKVN